MRMNSSRVDNPSFWERSFIKSLHSKGYTTGVFGKLLNNMKSYGCDGIESAADGIDRSFVMCNPAFYNEKWTNFTTDKSGHATGSVVHSGQKPEDYTTTMVGNASLRWLQSVIAQGPDHPPFFAFLGPHAPHLPSTPPPYPVDPKIAEIPVPIDPIYGELGSDKHSFLAKEPVINQQDKLAIQTEHTHRLQSLVAVDDVVRQVVEYLKSAGEWDNTYFFYTSDHGYNLGQFRVDSHKTMVYDHNLRVPMIVGGPGIAKGSVFPFVTSMVDLGPTMLELSDGGNNNASVPAYMDGMSFSPMLTGQGQRPWKGTALVEYLSIREKDTVDICDGHASTQEVAAYVDAYGYYNNSNEVAHPQLCKKLHDHPHDGPNNTFSALRIIDGSHDLLYAEFADVTNPLAWDFAPSQLNFFELYNVSADYYMRTNIYHTVSDAMREQLHQLLQTTIKCEGNADCFKTLKKQN